MRVKEPLNGFRKAQGHIIFHIAMLIGSYVILQKSYSNGPQTASCEAPDDIEKPEAITDILLVIRGMHGFLIASHFFRLWMDSDENDLIVKLMRVLEIFVYIGTILYQQFYVLKYPPS